MAVATGAFAPRAFSASAFYTSLVGPTVAAIPVGVSATITVNPTLTSDSDIPIGALAALSTGSAPLAVTAEIDIGTTAFLQARSALAATVTLAIRVDTLPAVTAAAHPLYSGKASGFAPQAFYVPQAFSAGLLAAGFSVKTTPALTAPVRFAATSTFAFATAAIVRGIPQFFAASSRFTFSTGSNLALVGPTASTLQMIINGVHVEDQVRVGSIQITDILNEAPNSAQWTMNTPVSAGADVKIGLQSTIGANLLFAGTVKQVEQSYDDRSDHPVWSVWADDYTFLINRRKVFGSWTNVSASQVALDALQRFTTGFSGAGITPGLPPITLSVDGVDFMDFLTQLANLIGGYAGGPDYSRVVWLFITDPRPAPDPLVPGSATLMLMPQLRASGDLSQVRTRVYVRGSSASLVGPSGAAFPAPAGAWPFVPVSDATAFAPAGQAITDDGQILGYTGTTPGDLTAVIGSNVAPPPSAPTPALAPGVAGLLSGWYQWAIAFSTGSGESTLGVWSIALFCPDVTTPTAAPGIGATGVVGPLAGPYSYRVAYLTTLGETLPGPIVSRYANPLQPAGVWLAALPTGVSRLTPGSYSWCATFVTPYGETVAGAPVSTSIYDLTPPSTPGVQSASGPGPLIPGATYRYCATFLTQDGETAGGSSASLVPSGLSPAFVSNYQLYAFGGLLWGSYSYGVTILTALGESALTSTYIGSSGMYTAAPPNPPTWSGTQDASVGAGRIEPQQTYYYASSYFSDAYGETALSNYYSQFVGGSYAIALLMNLNISLPPGADGIRVYRRISSSSLWTLNQEFRPNTTGIPVQFWDRMSQGDQGGNWPVQQTRVGVSCTVTVQASPESGVVGRRLYRTKAGGSEYFLVGEIQNNVTTSWNDSLPDAQLGTHNPLIATTGRQASVAVPNGPAGVLGRRLYRTKANGGVYYLVAELKDNYYATITDAVADSALTTAMPGVNSAGGAQIPRVSVPTGPNGVLARRLYRTKSNGSTYALVQEIADNTTTLVDDTTPDASLGNSAPPLVSTAGGETHQLSSIPIGPVGTLARVIYRTVAYGSDYRELVQISDNTTTSWRDDVADKNLGNGGVQLVNKAGASAVQLSNIPIGPAGVTQRVIYRAPLGTGGFRYVGSLDDNSTTTFLDTKSDSSLGRSPQDTSTIGALLGDTSLVIVAAANSAADFPPYGWVRVENQFIAYGAKSGNVLTAIPASGLGAITANIRGGAAVKTVPMLTGVIGQTVPLLVGARLSMWVTVNDPAAQAALAAIEGGDGVHEYIVTDGNLATIDAAVTRANAELELFSSVETALDYASRDRLTRSGAMIHCAMPAPQNIVGDFRIQQVQISDIDIAPRLLPKYTVHASTTKYSLADLLRHVAINWQGMRR